MPKPVSSKIHVVCFDLDDTLWPIEPVIQRTDQILHEWLLSYYPRLALQFGIEDLKQLRSRLLAEQPELQHDLGRLRKLSLAYAAAQVGYDESLVAPAYEIFQQARHQVTCYDDVLPVLTQLHSRYLLCALTNGTADVRRVGLGHLFDFAISASEVGAAKPHPAMFQAVCDHTQTTPAQVVHVGDDPHTDIAGALAVGMKTVWLNREHQPWPGIVPPQATITRLTELEEVFRGWENE